MNKPRLSFWQMWNMSFGFLGIQFGWGLQLANMSGIYTYLGAKPEQVPILWLAGPVTGLLVQPIIGSMSDRTWNRLGRRLLARLDAVAAFDADQFGNPPDRVVLQLVQFAVGIDDLPHQADEGLARLGIEMALQHAGEGIEVDRLIVGALAGGGQRFEFGAADRVALGEHRLEPLPLDILAHAVGIHHMIEQSRGGNARIVRIGARPGPGGQVFQKGQNAFEHGAHIRSEVKTGGTGAVISQLRRRGLRRDRPATG